jgi:hypothetical protein
MIRVEVVVTVAVVGITTASIVINLVIDQLIVPKSESLVAVVVAAVVSTVDRTVIS